MTIIKKYCSDNDPANSAIFKNLHDRGMKEILSKKLNIDQIQKELCQHLGYDLHQDYFII